MTHLDFDTSTIDCVLSTSLYSRDSIFSSVSPIHQTGEKYVGKDVHVINLKIVQQQYKKIVSAFSYAQTYVALKANSDHGIPQLLQDMGAYFEVATIEELRILEQLGVQGHRIMFTHPAKEAFEIAEAYAYGVRRFVTDSDMDLELLARHAPQTEVLVRMMSDNAHKRDDVITNMDRFGVSPNDVCRLVVRAHELGLSPVGVSFHIGTQEEDPHAWDLSIEKVSGIFFSSVLQKYKITLSVLDVGGGFPSLFDPGIAGYDTYAQTIYQTIQRVFGNKIPKEIIVEPGRSISAMAGITVGRVINVKSHQVDTQKNIVTISIGRFSAGLFGVGHSVAFYRRQSNNTFTPLYTSTGCYGYLYGKACASFDTPKDKVWIPADLQEGDVVVFTGTGAYTSKMMTGWCSKANPQIMVIV